MKENFSKNLIKAIACKVQYTNLLALLGFRTREVNKQIDDPGSASCPHVCEGEGLLLMEAVPYHRTAVPPLLSRAA